MAEANAKTSDSQDKTWKISVRKENHQGGQTPKQTA